MAAKKKRQDKTPPISADILRDVRCEITDDFETIGEIIGRLRCICQRERVDVREDAHDADQAGLLFFTLCHKFEDYGRRCHQFRDWVKESEAAK